MSQQSHPDGGQGQAFAAGRGLLAAAETLNFNMSESRPGLQMGGMASGVGMEGGDGGPPMSRLGSTMKLFASLGLSPADLDALAQIPEEDISVETLPHILRQLKSRKGAAAERRAPPAMSSEAPFKGGRDGWDNFGYGGVQDVPSGRPYGLNFGGGGAGGRDRPFSELPLGDSYRELGVGPSSSSSDFLQRRAGPPPHRKVQDFLGVMPPTFPHVCCLCDFDVLNLMEWNQHVDGIRHADNRRRLLHMYPEWDPGMSSSRGGGLLDSNMSSPLLGPPLISSTPSAGGMSSGWGRGGGGPAGPSKLRTSVVVVKYYRKPLSIKTLLAFAEPFGLLREHLILKDKAFFEMSSYEEALDMVSYYERNPATLFGKPLTFYLSKRLMNIQKQEGMSTRPADRPLRDIKSYGSRVVFFSNLPRDQEKKMELLTISARFGVVEKHIFLNDQAFVQLGTPEDAEMLVKYYSQNLLTIRGRPIRLNICAKYKTLDLNRRQGGSAGDGRGPRANRPGSGTRTSSSSHRTSSSRSSRSREEKKRESEEKRVKPEEEEEEEEEEEGVSGVMEGEEDGGEAGEEQEADGEAEEEQEEPREEAEESEEVQQVEVPGAEEVTEDQPEDQGRAEAEGERDPDPEALTPAEPEDQRREEPSEEPAESSEMVEESEDMDQDFLENMEDFVTLDELPEEDSEVQESDSIDNSRRGGMRVVTIVGFRRGFRFLDELLALAKPFGKVVKYLVLDMKPEAYLQFATEAEARAMDEFYYNSNVKVSVCGRPVTISHSSTYPTIQCGSSKVVYLGKIPFTEYTDASILKLAEPFGKIKKYFLNRNQNECFIEMERAEDAEKMVESSKANLIKFKGKRLTIYVSRKYRTLKYGHRPPAPSKRDSSSSSKSSRHSEEPPAKKQKEEKTEEREAEEEKTKEVEEKTEEKVEEEPSADKDADSAEKVPEAPDQSEKMDQDEVEKEAPEDDVEAPTNQNGEPEAAPPPQTKPGAATLPLPPFDPNSPIGVEHVKMGYYCRVCFLFYSSEDTAKRTHCSSQSHYDKLKKYLEKEKKTKKTSA